MKKLYLVLLFISIVNVYAFSQQAIHIPLIPYPKMININGQGKKTILSSDFTLFYNSKFSAKKINVFLERLSKIINCSIVALPLDQYDSSYGLNSIVLDTFKRNNKEESYSIRCDLNNIYVKNGHTGLFYALETLIQLFRYHYDKTTKQYFSPQYSITDWPTFGYRGMHLDVSRHFFSVEEIKKYIDLMSMFKYNYFHWHLTDDHGWRIEIKKYPKLISVGSKRKETMVAKNFKPYIGDGIPYSGHYTQEEVKAIIAYAEDRNIEIIPEIDLPGHSISAVAAYPYLSCSKKDMEVLTKWGSTEHPFCIGNDSTYEFVYNVLDEIIDLFPSKYVHIGGDECRRFAWSKCEVCKQVKKKKNITNNKTYQNVFTTKVVKYLNSKNKTAMVWDEITDDNITNKLDMIVMAWRSQKYVAEAVKRGLQVVVNHMNPYYLNFYESMCMNEPLAISGHNPLKNVYNHPIIPPKLNTKQKAYIVGGQVNLWTEYIPNFEVLTYMAYPRAIAMAEVLWGQGKKDYAFFVSRLLPYVHILNKAGIRVSNSFLNISSSLTKKRGKYEYDLQHPLKNKSLLVKTDKTDKFIPYKTSISVEDTAIIHSKYYDSLYGLTKEKSERIVIHKGIKARAKFLTTPHRRHRVNKEKNINNGIMEENYRPEADRWTGFLNKKGEIHFTFPRSTTIKKVGLNFLKDYNNSIVPPDSIEIKVKNKEGEYSTLFSSGKIKYDSTFAPEVETLYLYFKPSSPSRRYKVIVYPNKNEKVKNTWLFLGEIILD